jgi:hypothetical protein
MNDKWPRIKGEKINIRIAIIIYAVVGAVIGAVAGYWTHAIASGADGSVSFSFWLRHFYIYGVLWWVVVGAISNAALAYARKLLS